MLRQRHRTPETFNAPETFNLSSRLKTGVWKGHTGLQSDSYQRVYSRLETPNNRVFAAEVPNPHVTTLTWSAHGGMKTFLTFHKKHKLSDKNLKGFYYFFHLLKRISLQHTFSCESDVGEGRWQNHIIQENKLHFQSLVHCKKKKLSKLKSLRQPASADFWVFSTCCFKFIQQKVEKTQKYPKK